ncbi:rRNA maturation RNase YbeY [Desulfosarcina cetonica]|uniref:rRNA maturation RNase YbeY n=1 Tax=Desulfosarcina cetonica TaxID=90730 RepID=UPI0006CFC1BD|nr:rRNA maturation RNase YbeY [Desulfosarcina cetonica]
MEILIENRQNHHKLSKQKIRTTAKRILNALDYPEAQLSILIVDDDQIAELNQTYLNHTGPTNVISFPMQEGPFADITPGLLGDVVISVDTAHREAMAAGMEMPQRFNALLIHGILHLVGYDHVHSEEEAAVMEEKSDALMDLLTKEA